MLRWLTAGESHGPVLVAIVDGMPAHVEISTSDINADLARRRLGVGRGARQNFVADCRVARFHEGCVDVPGVTEADGQRQPCQLARCTSG